VIVIRQHGKVSLLRQIGLFGYFQDNKKHRPFAIDATEPDCYLEIFLLIIVLEPYLEYRQPLVDPSSQRIA
jgi:hypothetical protein